MHHILLHTFITLENLHQNVRHVTGAKVQFLHEQFSDYNPVQAILPWIVVTMENSVLSENERAFMIAGLVAVFLLVGEPFPLEISELIMPTGDGSRLQLPAQTKRCLATVLCPGSQSAGLFIYYLSSLKPQTYQIANMGMGKELLQFRLRPPCLPSHMRKPPALRSTVRTHSKYRTSDFLEEAQGISCTGGGAARCTHDQAEGRCPQGVSDRSKTPPY